MKSFIVVGLGRFGAEVACRLYQSGNEVLVIERSSELIQQICNDVTHAVVGDARDKEVLRALDVASFDCAVVAVGDSLADSVLATMNLKELGVPKIVCKAHDETHKQVLQKLGADLVVIPEKENAARLAKNLVSANVLEYIELSDECGIIEIPAPRSWLEKTLMQLNVRAKLGVNIIAIKRQGRINVAPGADWKILEGDIMVILGDTLALQAVQKL